MNTEYLHQKCTGASFDSFLAILDINLYEFSLLFFGGKKTITKVSENYSKDCHKCNVMPICQFQNVILKIR